MFFVIHKRTFFLLALLALFVGVFSQILWNGASTTVFQPQNSNPSAKVVVIDPGHGGEDGGAVAEDGTPEAPINLAIGLKLREIFFLAGLETQMTREEDISIHTAEAKTIQEKKVSDIRQRVAMINALPAPVLISIHQNSLPKAKSVHGAQVFYNQLPESSYLAASIQAALNAAINTDVKAKEEKAIDSSVYLMKHITCPGVLVECGFLSNAEEAVRLQSDHHQRKLAVTIAAGYLAAQNEQR